MNCLFRLTKTVNTFGLRGQVTVVTMQHYDKRSIVHSRHMRRLSVISSHEDPLYHWLTDQKGVITIEHNGHSVFTMFM